MFSFQGVSPGHEYQNLKRKPRGTAEDEGVIWSGRSVEEVAPVRRNFNSGKMNCREAEYRKPKTDAWKQAGRAVENRHRRYPPRGDAGKKGKEGSEAE